MRPSVQINVERLKYYREQRSVKQEPLAKLVRITRRSYQRIQQTGRTSPVTAQRLAASLGVSQDALTSNDPISQFDTAIEKVWLETIKYPLGGLLCSLEHALSEMEVWLKDAAGPLYRDACNANVDSELELRIDAERVELRLRPPSEPESEYRRLMQTFTFRPAVVESTGVRWIRFTPQDLDWWLSAHIQQAVGNSADVVIYNECRFPQSDNWAYAMVVRGDPLLAYSSLPAESGPPEADLQVVENVRDLLRIVRSLAGGGPSDSASSPQQVSCTATEQWSLKIGRLPGRLARQAIEVFRVERQGDGTLRRIPWTRAAREQLAEMVSAGEMGLARWDQHKVKFAPNLLAGGVLV